MGMDPSSPAPPRPMWSPSVSGRSPEGVSSAPVPRLAWLDALRGIAALVVVFDHSSYSFMAEFRRQLMPEFNTSRYGIMVFFLVSGYIIPASLERRGCVRTFWVGRLFRIYPLWAVVVTAFLAANLLGLAEIREFGNQGAVSVAVAHITLLQELLGTPNLLLVLWTLSYEMSFYLLVVALFSVRIHQRSAETAVALAVLAALSVAIGSTVPEAGLSGLLGTDLLVVAAGCAMVVAIGCASSSLPVLRVFGAALGGVLALVLVAFNGAVPMWEGLMILAVMFLGTALYRVDSGKTTWCCAVWTSAVVVSCAVGSAYLFGDGDHFTRRAWILSFLLSVLTFGTGLALRRRRIPRWLAWLGTISYSVYLVHPVLLAISDGTVGRWQHDNPVLVVAFYAVLLPLGALTYRYVEVPGQALGRKLVRRPRRQDKDLVHAGAPCLPRAPDTGDR